METTNNILCYIHTNEMSIKEISKETGIPVYKLKLNSSTPLNATELCALCYYLKIRPEDFYKKITNNLPSTDQ